MTPNNPVAEADRALAERLCFGMSEKAIGEAAMLICRHRSQEPVDVGREALKRTPMIEAITPTDVEWKCCKSIQDTCDLMKRRIDKAFALTNPPADDGGLREASNAAFDALDLADSLIERGYGMDVPQEWHNAIVRVQAARQSLAASDGSD